MEWVNKNNGILTFLGLVLSAATFFLAENKSLVLVVIGVTIVAVFVSHKIHRHRATNFNDVREKAKILFIDDKECQIVTNLRRNNFEVRKIDDVTSPALDTDVQWANTIFVDYKDVGKKLFGKKEGLGLITELKRTYGETKRYVIYSSAQDFDGLVEFPYIRKNASYDEFISLITEEVSRL
ncbi:MAG: hypothetical protein AAB440_02695 [Patescibacteria group bacterium]